MTDSEGPPTSGPEPRPPQDGEAPAPGDGPAAAVEPSVVVGEIATADAPPPADEPILPATLDDNALRDAVGAPPVPPKRKKPEPVDDDGVPRPASRKTIVIAAVAIITGLAIAALVFLGRANAQRYLITCSTDRVSAEQGRTFPPWGAHTLTGAEWKPIALPPNAECRPRETEDVAELERWYLELLVDRASTTLTARDLLDTVQAGKTNPLDVAADQLDQALLLSRPPERRDQRKDVERLLGDVQYWRASLRLREAAAALADAGRQFDAAAARRPRHVTDAGEWATFLQRLVDELHAGPGGVPATPDAVQVVPGGPSAPSAPAGTALPVEPEAPAEVVAPPDAGLPTGGVLL